MLRLLRHADCLVTLCSQAYAEAQAQGFADTRITVIPNGVDADRFKPQPSHGFQRKRIVYVGSLAATKGVDILIDALYSLRQEQPEIVLEIFGSGPEENQLKEKSATLGLADAVRFYGTVPDIEHHLDTPCIVVQPSLSEGMSNVILEAMAAGLPVVATRTGAAPEIIQDAVNGLLVDVGSAEQIHDAIARLLADEGFAHRIGMQARASIESRYSIDIVAGHYLSLYRSLNGTSG
jgi:glycosyltransferase involved in cell wall biosynthesis